MPQVTTFAPWRDLNLLISHRRRQQRHRSRFWLALGLPLLLALSGLLAWRGALQVRLAALPPPHTASIDPLDSMAPEDQRWLSQWLQQRAQAADLLTVLSRATPAGVALQTLEQKEALLALTGQASQPAALATMVQALRQWTAYRQVQRLEASAVLQQQVPVQQFVLELSRDVRPDPTP